MGYLAKTEIGGAFTDAVLRDKRSVALKGPEAGQQATPVRPQSPPVARRPFRARPTVVPSAPSALMRSQPACLAENRRCATRFKDAVRTTNTEGEEFT